MKIKFNSYDGLPLKTLKLYNMIIIVRSALNDGKKILSTSLLR